MFRRLLQAASGVMKTESFHVMAVPSEALLVWDAAAQQELQLKPLASFDPL